MLGLFKKALQINAAEIRKKIEEKNLLK